MMPFEMVEPTSLKEALSLLDPQEPTIRAVAGGTALMLMMKAGVFQPSRLVCLHNIEPEHSRITVTGNGDLRIGAMATLERRGARRQCGGAAAGAQARDADAVECAGAQCRARRRRAGARRSAHGSAAGPCRARRARFDQRPGRQSRTAGRRTLRRLLRNRSGKERTDHRRHGAGARRPQGRLHEGHLAHRR